MNRRLEGKVAIVTGAGTGIGEAIAKKFAKEGAKVVVNGLPSDPIHDVAIAINKSGGEAIAYAGDVADEHHARACVDAAVKQYGKLDVVVNNAGVFLATAETDDFPLHVFDEQVRANCRSAFLMTKYALPHLRQSKGNVICAGSEAGFNGLMLNTPYGGTKAFLHSFMMGVAVEQAKYGIRANCVCPGPIDTAWTHSQTGPMTKKMEKSMVAATPLGRRGTPEEIANVYAFLASDEASYVTGALWLADGGITPSKGPVGMEAKRDASTPPEGDLELQHAHDGLKGKGPVAIK
jgi:NAD(P)-dependent dehydrogenase (short-subunit alcohol dehydrogenase family)